MTQFRPSGFQQLPAVVKNIIIINVLVFLIAQLLNSRGISLDDTLGLHYWQSGKFRWWQLFTHMFMHANLTHIFFNMFALWMFGRILENVWGPQRFLIFYLVCGVGAAFCHLGVLTFEFTNYHDAFMQFQHAPTATNFVYFLRHHGLIGDIDPRFINQWSADPQNTDYAQQAAKFLEDHYHNMIDEATIGASGAVFGLLFAFGYLFPNTLLYLYFAIPIKAKWFVTGYALLELYSGISDSAGDNIAHFAHLGGMLFAFIMLRLWKNNVKDSFY
jgi:membrane associated rhomboid family serine protease